MKLLLLFTMLLFEATLLAQDVTDSTSYDKSIVHFHEYGKGEPFIILSGGPGNDCHQEEDVALKMSFKFHSILLEQRGTGESMPSKLDENSINLDNAIKDILFVMDSLKIGKAILFGHSWGALLATSFAVKYPGKVKSLVFVGPGPMSMDGKYWNQIPLNRLSKLSAEQKKRYFELFLKSRQKNTTNEEAMELLSLKNTMNVYDTTNTKDVFAKINKGVNNPVTYDLMIQNLYRIKFDLTSEIPNLTLPVTIITGKQDPLSFITHDFKNLYSKANVIWIENCGHFPMFEQPGVFYRKLSEALK